MGVLGRTASTAPGGSTAIPFAETSEAVEAGTLAVDEVVGTVAAVLEMADAGRVALLEAVETVDFS